VASDDEVTEPEYRIGEEFRPAMDKSHTPPSPTPEQQAFLLQEFNALRKEIEMEIKQLRDYLQAAILASGGIWAWFLSHPDPKLPPMAYFIPLFLSALLFAQTFGLRAKIFKLGDYIADIEKSFQLPTILGWERNLRSGRIKRDRVPRLEKTIWSCLCAGNLLAALFDPQMPWFHK
jgi:hypothetical protein